MFVTAATNGAPVEDRRCLGAFRLTGCLGSHCVAAMVRALPWRLSQGQANVAQRSVEMLIGRLVTDEQFRREFQRDPHATLFTLCDRGLELSQTEIAALLSTDSELWDRVAGSIDARLQKASLKDE
jgi:hypothetical protein